MRFLSWVFPHPTDILRLCAWCVAGGGAAGSAEEAERSGGWAGQILRVVKGCPGEAGASREESNRCEWRGLLFAVYRSATNNTVAHSVAVEPNLASATQDLQQWLSISQNMVLLLFQCKRTELRTCWLMPESFTDSLFCHIHITS